MSRTAVLELKQKDTGDRVELGGSFTGPYEGNYGFSLTLQTGETNENNHPVRDKIVKVRTAAGQSLDLTEYHLNLIVFEDMPHRPRRDEE